MTARNPKKFTVKGTGTFPFDMLRYDLAWPATPEDATALTGRDFQRARVGALGDEVQYAVETEDID